jgi:MFS family permease
MSPDRAAPPGAAPSPEVQAKASASTSITGQASLKLDQLLILAAVASSAVYSRSALSPLQESVSDSLELSDTQMAILQGPSLALPVILVALPVGLLVDRYRRASLLFFLALANLGASLLTSCAPTFAVLALARCIVGISVNAIFTSCYSMLSDLYAPQVRGRTTTAMSVAQIGGMSAVFALGGWFLEAGPASSGSWRWAMLMVSLPLIPVTAAILFLKEPARGEVANHNLTLRSQLHELWAFRPIVGPLLFGFAALGVGEGAALVWATPVFIRTYGLGPHETGAAMGIILLVGGIAGPVAGGVLADWCHRRRGGLSSIIGMTLLATICVPVSVFSLAPDAFAAMVCLAAFITIANAMSVMGTTLAMIAIPNELRGISMSIMFGASLLAASGIAPVAVAVLSAALALSLATSLAIVSATACSMNALILALAVRSFRPARR